MGVAPGGTEALPELGTTHTFACNNPCRLDTDELLSKSPSVVAATYSSFQDQLAFSYSGSPFSRYIA